MNPTRILVINLGSTSTKIAYVEDKEFKIRESITHDVEEIKACKDTVDQYDLRKKAVIDFCNTHGIDLYNLDSITSRGGQTEPITGGTYRINEEMVEQVRSMEYGHHVCGVGVLVAYDLCKETDHAVPLTTDTPTLDELDDIARFSGMKEIERVSCIQALNTKAMARYYAEQQNRPFEEVRVIVAMLGGGIAVSAIKEGRIVDAPDALEGEGPFSNNRCGTMPVGKIVKMCYSGQYDLKGMIRHINGESGLMSYLGTTDMRKIMSDIENGDEYAKSVIEAMCYQTSKEIGAMATVLEGKVDAVLLIAGMANIRFITDEIKKRCSWIAPVVILPGEREMESLALGSYEALNGIREMKEFVPKENK